ncbi:MAG: 50S ribosomal protein L22 [Alphaproteobacteria bacterium]|nr:50S ribosomal protein L22 [Alphaproteobacteria bacterium]
MKKQVKTAYAKARLIRISPQKLNLVAETIRGLKADKALAELTFSKKRVSTDVKKVLQAAIANAENNFGMDIDKLYVAEAYVGKAMVMKRWHAAAKGAGHKILKPFSNLTVVVAEKEAQKAPKAEKTAEKAPKAAKKEKNDKKESV